MQTGFESVSENSDTSFDHYAIYDLDSEPEDDYGKGGYMKLQDHTEIAEQYSILQKIGWGHGGIVYLAKDKQTNTFVALKIIKSHRYYRQEFKDELKILKKIPDSKYTVNIIEHFIIEKANQDHTVVVYELMGVTLYEILKHYKFNGLPIALCRFIGKEILKGLVYFHEEQGIIVGDLRLKNILMPMTKAQQTSLEENGVIQEKLDYAIFKHTDTPHAILNKYLGTSFVLESGKKVKGKGKKGKKAANPKDILKKLNRIGLVNEEFCIKFNNLSNSCLVGDRPAREFPSVNYNSPETVLKLPYTTQSDMWSFGCIMFELVTGHYLFEPYKGKHYKKEEDLLGQMQEILGIIPLELINQSEVKSKYFDEAGKLKHLFLTQEWPLKDLLIEKYYLNYEEATGFCNFLKDILCFDAEKRLNAKQALEHKWFKMPAKDTTHLSKEKIKEVDAWVKKREFEYWQTCFRNEEYKFLSKYK